MKIIKDFIPMGRKNRPKISIHGPKYLTIHDTANTNKGTDAIAHSSYLKGDTAENLLVSWHYTVDDKRVVQHLPLNQRGFHAGDGKNGQGNRTSIGLEICENKDGNRQKAEENAIRLAAKLIIDNDLNISRVVQHNKWNGKNCPRVLRNRPKGWQGFLNSIEKEILNISNEEHWGDKYIREAMEAGLINTKHNSIDKVIWAELAAVIVRLNRKIES